MHKIELIGLHSICSHESLKCLKHRLSILRFIDVKNCTICRELIEGVYVGNRLNYGVYEVPQGGDLDVIGTSGSDLRNTCKRIGYLF